MESIHRQFFYAKMWALFVCAFCLKLCLELCNLLGGQFHVLQNSKSFLSRFLAALGPSRFLTFVKIVLVGHIVVLYESIGSVEGCPAEKLFCGDTSKSTNVFFGDACDG